MDLPLYTDSESEETAIEDDADIDDAAFDNPRCGICMDVIIDRGALDCCQDWFCFACIDNWAAITNLCPFCKNEFQLITCLPVYDTVGSINSEDHSFSRDDEWLIQGKNNTLSFPSYYINEEAVVCLDGDGCKIRSGFATSEDELNVDTSIACDSCDIWYHAFCVGFNSSCTSDGSWLCPRCVSKQGVQKPDAFIMQNVISHSEPKRVDLGWSVDYPFAGKVSVSVADTGDTDVVVSMVEEKPGALASENLSTDCLDVDRSKLIAINMTNVADGSDNVEIGFQAGRSGCGELVPCSTNCIDPTTSETIAFCNNSEIVSNFSSKAAIAPADILKDKFAVVPSIHDTLLDMKPNDHKLETSIAPSASQNPSSTYFDPSLCGFLRPKTIEEKFKLDNNIDICKIPKPCSAETDNGLPLNISVDNIHPDPSAASSTSVDLAKDKILCGICEDADRHMPHRNFGDGSLVEEDVMETVPDAIDADFLIMSDRKRERDMEEKIEMEHSIKKTRSDGKHQMVLLEKEVCNFALDSTKKDLSPITVKDDALKHTPGKDGKALDIMSLVQENKHRASNISSYTDSTEILMQKRDGAAGLRVKKIMRSVGDNKESSVLIQNLRKEIREAVQDKTPNIIDKVKILNGELLTAFRAALARPQNEVADKTGLSHVAMRKPFLQKGKTRENLTKKIYQTSTGRRKKAWDRDCEVEFWKRRCLIAKPQKVETLQSVLELLRKGSSSSLENSEIDQDPHKQTTDSILSRVYLADASVFPRKDDIKPLSVLEGCQGVDSHNQQSNISGKDSQHVCATNMTKNAVGISDCRLHGKVPSTDNGEKKLSAPNFKKEAPCQKGKSNGAREAPTTIVGPSSSKESTLNSNEASKHSSLAKTDKKKWALEVLARKNALSNADTSKGNQEDRSPLKGNYPLLAQLPEDMMPMPAPSRFNKVPLSVRQAQLNRIAEHYLKRTNLNPMRRTAITELAVADSVNVEKDIAERSNSKSVYVNLCSQVLSQRKTKPQTSDNIIHGPITTSTQGADFRVEVMCSNSVLTEGGKVEEALKLAGLDDTPPNSPCRPGIDTEAEDTGLVKVGQEDLPDVHSHPDSNVFGDSVCILDDGGSIISSSAMDAGPVHPEDLESRIKVVPSSVNCAKSGSKCAAQNIQGSEQESMTTDQHDLRVVEASSDTSTMLACQSNTQLEVRVPVLHEPSHTDFNRDPSFEECEENRMILDKLSVEVTGGLNNTMETDAAVQHQVCCDIENLEKSNKEFLIAEICTDNNLAEGSPSRSLISEKAPTDGIATVHSHADSAKSISRKVEAYIKEHIRPLCKSGIITVQQYRWAVTKTTEKVMKFHYKAKNANFLIKEGAKVKKLAEDYVEAAQQKEWT